MNIRKLTITAFLIAINVVLSSLIVIPLGPIKAAPVQHFVNVLCAVFVGPWYGLAQAFISLNGTFIQEHQRSMVTQ